MASYVSAIKMKWMSTFLLCWLCVWFNVRCTEFVTLDVERLLLKSTRYNKDEQEPHRQGAYWLAAVSFLCCYDMIPIQTTMFLPTFSLQHYSQKMTEHNDFTFSIWWVMQPDIASNNDPNGDIVSRCDRVVTSSFPEGHCVVHRLC